jgi:DNA ligase-1
MMRHFAYLIDQLDTTTKTNQRVAYLVGYFEKASEQDALWAVALFLGKRPKRSVSAPLIRQWASEAAGIPLWLFEESYHVVGDLAETISLLLPEPGEETDKSLGYWVGYLAELRDMEEPDKEKALKAAWKKLTTSERFVFNKLMTGGFRIGISQKLMTRALSKYLEIDENVLAHKLMGDWRPDTTTFDKLFRQNLSEISQPYPFYLAYAIEGNAKELGRPEEWMAERKWDGIRGQLIVRKDQIFIWSRGEELVTKKYPELHDIAANLPNGTVLDGELLAYKNDRPLDFALMQKRIGRKNVGKQLMNEIPVVFMAYDMLEWEGRDIRAKHQYERRQLLEEVISKSNNDSLMLSPLVSFDSWANLDKEMSESRPLNCEGLMLKRKEGTYRVGRKKGDWWKWKVDPYTIDAVMIYAMRGHGRRANLYTDYTFAVWHENELIPFAKAYSGLTDKEFAEVDRFIRKNTIDRFGPVRSVEPQLVFEIAFEGISKSSRHKSGVAVRFPRMHRWRRDKAPGEANSLADLNALIEMTV